MRNWALIKQWDANHQEVSGGGMPIFFGECAQVKYVEDGVSLLQGTQEGKEWISRLHSHVFECEHFLLGKDEKIDSQYA